MISRSTVRLDARLGHRRPCRGLRGCQEHAGQRSATRTQATDDHLVGRQARHFRSTATSPGGCQSRALAMCKGANYAVLKMDNMPTRGDVTSVVRGSGLRRGPLRVIA